MEAEKLADALWQFPANVQTEFYFWKKNTFWNYLYWTQFDPNNYGDSSIIRSAKTFEIAMDTIYDKKMDFEIQSYLLNDA